MITHLTTDDLASIRARAVSVADSAAAHLLFIAHAPADVLTLLDTIDSLRDGIAAAVSEGFELFDVESKRCPLLRFRQQAARPDDHLRAGLRLLQLPRAPVPRRELSRERGVG
jgi:hypothetical protein